MGGTACSLGGEENVKSVGGGRGALVTEGGGQRDLGEIIISLAATGGQILF